MLPPLSTIFQFNCGKFYCGKIYCGKFYCGKFYWGKFYCGKFYWGKFYSRRKLENTKGKTLETKLYCLMLYQI